MLDIRHGHRLDAPGVVDQDLTVDAELLVKPVLAADALLRDFAHREHVVFIQAPGLAGTDLPEIGQGRVVPEQIAVGVFVELGDAHAVTVGPGLLGNDIHRDLGQVEVCADAHGGGDAGGL